MKPKATGVVPKITLNVPQRQLASGYALKFSSSLQIDKAGKYTFYLSSDDGSRLYVDKKLVIDNDGQHGMSEKKGAVELSVGTHPLVVTYYNGSGDQGLEFEYSGPGMHKQALPLAKLWTGAGESLGDVAIDSLQSIPGHDEEKFRDLAKLLVAGRNRDSAIRAMGLIPKQAWQKNLARSLVDNLTAYVSGIPASLRTGPSAVEAIALAKQLASLLPSEEAGAALSRFENLDVRVIAVGTLPERMLYDKERIAVQTGKPIEFRFSNTDAMPHNFAITTPGAMEEIGLLAEATARDADAMQRNYVPKSNKILLASRLLQPGESQALSFEAPKEAGVYPYVCTYPGHWRRMYGELIVVDDLDAYGANPDSYLAAHNITVKDDLLKQIGQSHEWTVDELLESVKTLGHDRSFAVGQNAFKVASCIACHHLNEPGRQIGPDLAKLDPAKQNAEHILRSVVTPSEKIDEKFLSNVFVLDNGKVVTGMVVEETAELVKVIDNPLAKVEPVVIIKTTIDTRDKSNKSIMPQGLLSKLTREEVLDLIAYVLAKGDKAHPMFGGHAGHDHHHAH